MDEFSGLSEDELIALLSQLGGGNMPGKTPANQLNYYQDLVSTLGFDPVQQAGLGEDGTAEAPEYTPKVNKQRAIYKTDPVYTKMFDLIDQGASPASAVAASGIKDPDQAKEFQAVALDYAGSLVDEANDRQKFDESNQKNAAKYTAPDGSKYKNAPLGGNDIYGSASEYDLMGAPTAEDLLVQLAGQKAFQKSSQTLQLGPQARSNTSTGTEYGDTQTPHRPGRGHNVPRGPATQVTNPLGEGAGGERSWEKPTQRQGTAYIGGDIHRQAAARAAANSRIEKSKSTQVRSDANTNAMRRILALRTILSG